MEREAEGTPEASETTRKETFFEKQLRKSEEVYQKDLEKNRGRSPELLETRTEANGAKKEIREPARAETLEEKIIRENKNKKIVAYNEDRLRKQNVKIERINEARGRKLEKDIIKQEGILKEKRKLQVETQKAFAEERRINRERNRPAASTVRKKEEAKKAKKDAAAADKKAKEAAKPKTSGGKPAINTSTWDGWGKAMEKRSADLFAGKSSAYVNTPKVDGVDVPNIDGDGVGSKTWKEGIVARGKQAANSFKKANTSTGGSDFKRTIKSLSSPTPAGHTPIRSNITKGLDTLSKFGRSPVGKSLGYAGAALDLGSRVVSPREDDSVFGPKFPKNAGEAFNRMTSSYMAPLTESRKMIGETLDHIATNLVQKGASNVVERITGKPWYYDNDLIPNKEAPDKETPTSVVEPAVTNPGVIAETAADTAYDPNWARDAYYGDADRMQKLADVADQQQVLRDQAAAATNLQARQKALADTTSDLPGQTKPLIGPYDYSIPPSGEVNKSNDPSLKEKRAGMLPRNVHNNENRDSKGNRIYAGISQYGMDPYYANELGVDNGLNPPNPDFGIGSSMEKLAEPDQRDSTAAWRAYTQGMANEGAPSVIPRAAPGLSVMEQRIAQAEMSDLKNEATALINPSSRENIPQDKSVHDTYADSQGAEDLVVPRTLESFYREGTDNPNMSPVTTEMDKYIIAAMKNGMLSPRLPNSPFIAPERAPGTPPPKTAPGKSSKPSKTVPATSTREEAAIAKAEALVASQQAQDAVIRGRERTRNAYYNSPLNPLGSGSGYEDLYRAPNQTFLNRQRG